MVFHEASQEYAFDMLKFASAFLLCIALLASPLTLGESYDLVINHGRVIDPESGLDALRHIGIMGDEIVTVAKDPLEGRESIDTTGLVVSPGFIDLHTHSPTLLGQYFQAFDGVTTALELEAGFHPVNDYGGLISDTPLINYGAAAGYVAMRMLEKNGIRMGDAMGSPRPVGWKGWRTAITNLLTDSDTAMSASLYEQASPEELQILRSMLQASLDDGSLGIGLPLDYFSAAIQNAELQMIFSVAAERHAPIFVHIRRGIDGDPTGLREMIALAKQHGTAVHICHITHNAMSNLDLFLAEINEAQSAGVDITTEVLPYNAGSALISSAVFGRDWQAIFNITYEDVEWAATGERFNEQMWQEYYNAYPDGQVIHHYLKEEWTQRAVQEPDVIIVSDLMPMKTKEKKVAPHNGAFSKVLGRYVREEKLLDLNTAIAKMTLLPARRLEKYAPVFGRKGRLQPGMDADITIFDPATIRANATYQNPYQEATGIVHVIVNGTPVIRDGSQVEGKFPGVRLTSIMDGTQSSQVSSQVSGAASM
jgi:N-acyl-D-aspartate/D-glutamate deacylase